MRALRSKKMRCSASQDLRSIIIDDWMINFRDIKENLKIRIWLQIQNGNLDRHENIVCVNVSVDSLKSP